MNVFGSEAGTYLYEHDTIMGKTHIAWPFQLNDNHFGELIYAPPYLMQVLSKQYVTFKTLQLLYELAHENHLKQWIKDLYNSEEINISEDQPALHSALRALASQRLRVDSEGIIALIHKNHSGMETLVNCIHTSRWLGYTDIPICTHLNTSAGCVNLSPCIVSYITLEELTMEGCHKVENHFGSTMEDHHISSLLNRLKRPDQHEGVGETRILKRHFIRISALPQRMIDRAIPEPNLSLLLALIGAWSISSLDITTHAILALIWSYEQ